VNVHAEGFRELARRRQPVTDLERASRKGLPDLRRNLAVDKVISRWNLSFEVPENGDSEYLTASTRDGSIEGQVPSLLDRFYVNLDAHQSAGKQQAHFKVRASASMSNGRKKIQSLRGASGDRVDIYLTVAKTCAQSESANGKQ